MNARFKQRGACNGEDGQHEQAVHRPNCALDVQITTANVIKSPVVLHHRGIHALKEGMRAQEVVRLNSRGQAQHRETEL